MITTKKIHWNMLERLTDDLAKQYIKNKHSVRNSFKTIKNYCNAFGINHLYGWSMYNRKIKMYGVANYEN